MTLALQRLKKRADFLAIAARKRRFVTHSLVIQYAKRDATEPKHPALPILDPNTIRIGFTVTKKQGNAVVRNRIRRRLKEAAKSVFPDHGKSERDYVIIGRHSALERDFEALKKDMIFALSHIHRRGDKKPKDATASTTENPSN